MACITMLNKIGLSTDPWCTPTLTSKLSLSSPFLLTAVVTPSYKLLLTFMLGRLNLLHIINLKTLCFFIKMNNCVTPVNATKQYFENFYKFSSECSSLFFKYNCYGVWNISGVRRCIYQSFKDSCISSESE